MPISSLTFMLFGSMIFEFPNIWEFLNFSWLLISKLILFGQRFQSFKIHLDLFYGLECAALWWMFSAHFFHCTFQTCVLWFCVMELIGVWSRQQTVFFKFYIFIDFSVFFLPVTERGLLKSLYMIMRLSKFVYSYVSFTSWNLRVCYQKHKNLNFYISLNYLSLLWNIPLMSYLS